MEAKEHQKAHPFPVSAIVLAGGKSSRLGRNKALEILGKENLVKQVVSRLSNLSNEIIVAIAPEQVVSFVRTQPATRVVVDLYPGKGPLAGIYTGLSAANTSHSIVVACDMPFLNQSLLCYLVELSPAFDIVVPRVEGMSELLHAVYSRECLAPIEHMLQQDRLRVSDLLRLVKVRYVGEEEINRFDPKHLSFFNINTKADMERAKALASGDLLQVPGILIS